MASVRVAAAVFFVAVTWVHITTTTAAVTANKSSPIAAKARLPASLLSGTNESQQKQLNPQMLAFFLRPLASYLASFTGAAPATSTLDDWEAVPSAQSLALPAAAPSKLSLLASLFGFGQPAATGAENPSYQLG